MPVVLIVFGVVIAMAVVNDQLGKLGQLAKEAAWPASGHGFFVWAAAIIVLGAILRILNLPDAGKALIVLIVLAYVLGHSDIPGQFLKALQASGKDAQTATPSSGGSNASSGSGNGGASPVSSISSAIPVVTGGIGALTGK